MVPIVRYAICVAVCAVILHQTSHASLITIGPNGIDSNGLTLPSGLTLTGAGIGIGQVETGRPGKSMADGGFDSAMNSNSSVVPADVYVRATGGAGIANMNISAHGENVAGVLISTDTTDPDGAGPLAAPTGIAPDALLYSSATNPVGPNYDQESAVTVNHIATRNGGDMRAVNMSTGNPLDANHTKYDGNQLLTQFVDWSAAQKDILYVVSGNQGNMNPIPKDNFNGMTVGASTTVGGVYRRVASFNDYSEDATGDRTSIDLIAPGTNVDVTDLNNTVSTVTGTSFAAPHVTGTVALLQEYADDQIASFLPGWDADARRHEVMKAVLMNSADKLIDNGTVMVNGNAVPQGSLLGMTRTVLKKDGTSTWLDSFAYDDDAAEGQGTGIPLDLEMGTGHLNARRAIQQFIPGEQVGEGADVPSIGWDYGTTAGQGDDHRYRFDEEFSQGQFISITLAWDRQVEFANDMNMNGEYDVGDTFEEYNSTTDPIADSVINDLDLLLLPRNSFDPNQAIAA